MYFNEGKRTNRIQVEDCIKNVLSIEIWTAIKNFYEMCGFFQQLII